jgi:hypothetical protein
VDVPTVRVDERPGLTKRLRFIEDAKAQFWKKWMQQVFRNKILSPKWRQAKRDAAVGDVVLLAEAENDDPTYRLGVIDGVKTGEDGHVRTVNIRYTNPGKIAGTRSPPKTTTRPIHKIAVLVPVGYRFDEDGVSAADDAE